LRWKNLDYTLFSRARAMCCVAHESGLACEVALDEAFCQFTNAGLPFCRLREAGAHTLFLCIKGATGWNNEDAEASSARFMESVEP